MANSDDAFESAAGGYLNEQGRKNAQRAFDSLNLPRRTTTAQALVDNPRLSLSERIKRSGIRLSQRRSVLGSSLTRLSKIGGTKKRAAGVKKLFSAVGTPVGSRPRSRSAFRPPVSPQESNLSPRNIMAQQEAQRTRDLQAARYNSTRLSANTKTILDRLRSIQTKGPRDNFEMQRRIRERRAISMSSNLLKTPSLFGPESNTMNVLAKDEFNITDAPNVFKSENQSNIMDSKGRPSILNTKESGNNLSFF